MAKLEHKMSISVYNSDWKYPILNSSSKFFILSAYIGLKLWTIIEWSNNSIKEGWLKL